MRGSNERATNKTSGIECLEVLILKEFITNSHNLRWTLSVYSLENQPVQRNREIQNFEIFHFMVFDWKRTIKKLLDGNQVPYSIVRYFRPGTIYPDSVKEDSRILPHETEHLSAIKELRKAESLGQTSALFSKISEKETGQLILDEKDDEVPTAKV